MYILSIHFYILVQACKLEEETCGYQSTYPPTHHGKCCEGFTCTYSVNMTGSPGTCKKGNVDYMCLWLYKGIVL